MPGLLKGWIDRVFSNGWAFDFVLDQRFDKKLQHLKVHLLGIGGADAGTFERHGYRAAMKAQIDHGIFDYCGAQVVSPSCCWNRKAATRPSTCRQHAASASRCSPSGGARRGGLRLKGGPHLPGRFVGATSVAQQAAGLPQLRVSMRPRWWMRRAPSTLPTGGQWPRWAGCHRLAPSAARPDRHPVGAASAAKDSPPAPGCESSDVPSRMDSPPRHGRRFGDPGRGNWPGRGSFRRIRRPPPVPHCPGSP